MKTKFAAVVGFLLVGYFGFLSTICFAEESLADKKYWAKQDKAMAEVSNDVKKHCGRDIPFAWANKKSFAKMDKKYTPNGVCSNVVEAVASLCKNEKDAKESVGKKIQKIECQYAPKGGRALALTAGTLTYSGNNEDSNFDKWANDWLMQNL